MTTEDFLADLAASLRGGRRHRRRLIAEVAAHIDDAVRAELAAGTSLSEAERIVLDRLGGAGVIARRWNTDRSATRGRRRRRLGTLAVAVVGAGALGITQYASGKPQPPSRHPPARTPPDLTTCPNRSLRSSGRCVSSLPGVELARGATSHKRRP